MEQIKNGSLEGATTAAEPHVTMTITRIDPETGKPEILTYAGAGVVFGFLKEEKHNDDGTVACDIAAGIVGAFSKRSMASAINGVEDTAYSNYPELKSIRMTMRRKKDKNSDPIAAFFDMLLNNPLDDDFDE